MNTAVYETIGDKEVVGLLLQAYDRFALGSWASRVSNIFQSNSAVEKYAGVGNAPQLREWVGQRLVKQLREYSMTVTNKDYEGTLEVFVKDLRRDKTSQLMPKLESLAQKAATHDEYLLSNLIDVAEADTISTSYDGQYFFDTDHSVGSSGTINNDISVAAATGTAPTAAEAAGAILSAIQAIYGFKDDQGEPINQGLREFMVMVPTGYWATHMTAVTKENLASAADNPLVGSGLNISLVVNPRLTWTTKIAVFATDGPTKPFLIQQEEPVSMTVIGAGSEYEFQNNAHLYGVKKSGNVAYWDFTKACIVTYT